jgi:hypothetical protein
MDDEFERRLKSAQKQVKRMFERKEPLVAFESSAARKIDEANLSHSGASKSHKRRIGINRKK